MGQDAPAIVGWIGIRLGSLWDWLLIWGCGVLWDFIWTGMGRTKEQDDGVDDGIVGLCTRHAPRLSISICRRAAPPTIDPPRPPARVPSRRMRMNAIR